MGGGGQEVPQLAEMVVGVGDSDEAATRRQHPGDLGQTPIQVGDVIEDPAMRVFRPTTSQRR
jgi:hypothetical protein